MFCNSLHYANVTVGTPSDWFMVALDTGSDLFWLPCDCTNCVRELKAPGGSVLFRLAYIHILVAFVYDSS
jgi:hypothetical protein